MTAYEYLDLALNTQANGISLLSFGFGLLSAYLIVAYVVGSKLTVPQVIAITLIYSVATFFNLAAHVAAVVEASDLRLLANDLNSELNLRLFPRIAYIIIFIRIAIYLISIWFMWNIRHPKTE
jgi:hypothetical protein